VKSRVLPVINAIGCLVLTGLVVGQWRKEHTLVREALDLEMQLGAARGQAATESKRSAALEQDIVVLKESIEAVQKSAEQSAGALAQKETEVGGLQTEITAARGQLKVWEEAIATRDARLRELNGELIATRRRLDEAVAKLKEAGAR
jgi:septal ring factor EnvC (AmiA/AmiB activator)